MKKKKSRQISIDDITTKDYTIRHLPNDLHKKIKMKAAEQGITIQELIVKILEAGIGS